MTRSIHAAAIIAAVILSFCFSSLIQAAVPDSLNYQGYLANADGSPVNGDVVIEFRIYTVDLGGVELWFDSELVAVDQGLFSVELGGLASPFPSGMFDTPLWLGVTVDSDAEMLPRRPLTAVGFAFEADNAMSLQGQGPASFDQSAHLSDTANPHAVSVAQVGAASSSALADLQAQFDAALATIGQLEIDLANEVANRIADVNAEETARIANDIAEANARVSADSMHDSDIADIQANTVLALDGLLTFSAGDTALFDGVNVQVVNGSGSTNGAINGVGNLIVGYDAPRASGSDKSGSHNLVVGDNHNYTSYGGLVSGFENTVSGVSASVSGGKYNTASGIQASVSGGQSNAATAFDAAISGGSFNVASGEESSVSGGRDNTAQGTGASVIGGFGNMASGDYASVSGGETNTASEDAASVIGGRYNSASGEYSSVSGGRNNIASWNSASVTGGRFNIASAYAATVAGGGGSHAEDGNEASADYSATLGNTYRIGDVGPAGGIVFHITAGGLHGLEAAPVDHTSLATWGCDGTEIREARRESIGVGAQNTAEIIAACSTPDIAARIADSYSLSGFDDWVLPSKDELNLMYLNLAYVGQGNFTGGTYWSSSEFNVFIVNDQAWGQDLGTAQQTTFGKNVTLKVRAVRAF